MPCNSDVTLFLVFFDVTLTLGASVFVHAEIEQSGGGLLNSCVVLRVVVTVTATFSLAAASFVKRARPVSGYSSKTENISNEISKFEMTIPADGSPAFVCMDATQCNMKSITSIIARRLWALASSDKGALALKYYIPKTKYHFNKSQSQWMT